MGDGEDRGPEDGPDDDLGPPRNRFEIRILPDGSVVFVDLPGGLAEVAQVVAGSAPEMERPSEASDGDDP